MLTVNKRSILIVLVAVWLASFLYFVSGMWQNLRHSTPTGDEQLHTVAGVLKWKYARFSMGAYQPPLGQLLLTLPGPWMPGLRVLTHDPAYRENRWEDFSDVFFYRSGNDAMAVLRACRMLALLWTALFVLACTVIWSRFSGWAAALAASTWLMLHPHVLAHGAAVRMDILAMAFFFFAVCALLRYLSQPSDLNLFVAALAFALAQLTKAHAWALLPAVVFLFFKNPFKIEIAKRKSFVVFLLVWLGLTWALYGFEFRPLLDDAAARQHKVQFILDTFQEHPRVGTAVLAFAERVPIPAKSYWLTFPNTFLRGLAHRGAHLDKNFRDPGFWFFYPGLWAMKTSLTQHAVWCVALGLCLWQGLFRRPVLATVSFCYVWMLPFLFFNSAQSGLQHALPFFPWFAWVLGAAVAWLWEQPKTSWALALASVLFVTAQMAELAPVGWDYLSYFNRAAGGPTQGFFLAEQVTYPRLLSSINANYEWGQHLGQLREVMLREGISKVYMRDVTYHYYFYELQRLSISAAIENDLQKPQALPERYVFLAGGEWTKLDVYKTKAPVAVVGFNGRIYRMGADS